MKKRLLITSIVMMLVVAVALSTATYAWFTSNASVTASTVTMTAATNGAAALGIGWDGGNAGTSISATLTETLSPMAPVDLTANSTQYNVAFKTATIKTENNTVVFNSDLGPATPITFNNGESGESKKDTFYVKNLSGTNGIDHVTITASIGAAAGNENNGDSLVRIAVFKRATSGSGNYVLVGVISSNSSQKAVWGPAETKLKAGEAISGLNQFDTVTSIDLGPLAANGQFDLAIVTWMDGTALDDSKAGFGATISFTFTATNNTNNG